MRLMTNKIKMTGEFKKKYYDITNLIQQEFDRNLQKYGEKIQCRRGCSQCCSQIFNITLIDAEVIREYVKSLSLERKRELKQRAQTYIDSRSQTEVWERGGSGNRISGTEGIAFKGSSDEFSVKPGIPCPALGNEGECTIYEARPVICRRFGIPIYDYKNPGKVYACELNFKDGEEIIDENLIPNQTSIGKKWDELKEEYEKNNGNDGDRNKNFTTIADTILNA